MVHLSLHHHRTAWAMIYRPLFCGWSSELNRGWWAPPGQWPNPWPLAYSHAVRHAKKAVLVYYVQEPQLSASIDLTVFGSHSSPLPLPAYPSGSAWIQFHWSCFADWFSRYRQLDVISRDAALMDHHPVGESLWYLELGSQDYHCLRRFFGLRVTWVNTINIALTNSAPPTSYFGNLCFFANLVRRLYV